MNDTWLWVTGGLTFQYTINAIYMKTTEFISVEPGKSRRGPDLEGEISAHCMVKINDSYVMVTGGQSGKDKDYPWLGARKRVTIYDLTNPEWMKKPNLIGEAGPTLLQATKFHGCTSLKSKLIFVAGGLHFANIYLHSVQILNLKSWTRRTGKLICKMLE